MNASTNISLGSIPARCRMTASTAARPTLGLMIFLSAAFLPACNRDNAANDNKSENQPAAGYVANSNSRIVHRSDCKYVAKMKPDHRVPFEHLADAVAEGYRPCKSCLPAAATNSATAPTGVSGSSGNR